MRLEFDHSRLDYYTELDAVLLVGTKKPIPSTDESFGVNENDVDKGEQLSTPSKSVSHLTKEIMKLKMHTIPPQVRIFWLKRQIHI